ncbi:MAG: phage tail sheath subtilisin-like domain-containing protein, partial [Gammaproteobacteria bacterium]|nr:phage tail sheath subtilisin-like domain-containing protein [Gammaproteobacteria bacterium]
MISVNGSAAKTVTLPSSFSNASTRANVAAALQEQIRAALAISEIDARVSGNAFEIETTGTHSSSSEIRLIDSELLTALGLSSSHVATLTGADTGATPPAITSGNKFSVTLDAFNPVDVSFAGNISGGGAIATEIERQLRNANPDITSFAGFTCSFDSAAHKFTLKSGGTDVLESTIGLSDGAGTPLVTLKLDAATAKNGRSMRQGIDQIVPRAMAGSSPAPGFGERLHNGQNSTPVAADFTSFYNTTLRKYRDVSIIVLPGSSWDGASGQANIAASLAHCESMKNRMLIIDPAKGKELQNATVVSSLGLPTSTYSVLYYPWVSMANPGYHPDKTPNADKNVLVAPSAIAAGMWAKIDGKRGVWKAPAGVEARVTGAAGLQFNVENLEQDQLNPLGINCIRKLPNYGSVFWGSRSLATKADPEWRYVPVRRTAIYIEESIYNGIQWAVFEPNNHHLWSSLRANVGSFMNGLFRAGAFQGQTANDAYFVRCGLGDTMTQGDIDRGQVIVTIGFAPLKPAEFVIVRIQ